MKEKKAKFDRSLIFEFILNVNVHIEKMMIGRLHNNLTKLTLYYCEVANKKYGRTELFFICISFMVIYMNFVIIHIRLFIYVLLFAFNFLNS